MNRIPALPWLCMSLLAISVADLPATMKVEAPLPPAEEQLVRVGRLKFLFAAVDFRDSKVAVEFWVTQLASEMGIRASATLELLHDLDAVVAGVAEGRIDVVTLSPLDYLWVAERVAIKPISVGVIDGKITDEFVLLVRRNREFTGLAQLKGRTIAVESARYAYPVASMWLETELLKNGLGSPDDFFRDVAAEARASKAIVGTLFGQVDGSLVTRRTYDTMVELNPQVGKELTPLLGSPPYLREIMCGRTAYMDRLRGSLIDAALRAHEYPTSRQILQLFGQERVVPFEARYLRTVRSLAREHRALVERSSATEPSP